MSQFFFRTRNHHLVEIVTEPRRQSTGEKLGSATSDLVALIGGFR